MTAPELSHSRNRKRIFPFEKEIWSGLWSLLMRVTTFGRKFGVCGMNEAGGECEDKHTRNAEGIAA